MLHFFIFYLVTYFYFSDLFFDLYVCVSAMSLNSVLNVSMKDFNCFNVTVYINKYDIVALMPLLSRYLFEGALMNE